VYRSEIVSKQDIELKFQFEISIVLKFVPVVVP
jgi:hypothetical protein